MAIAFKSTISTALSAAATSITVALPTSPALASGDLMIGFVTVRSATLTPSTPTGWTAIGSVVHGSNQSIVAWYRFWQSGDTDPVSSWASNVKGVGYIHVYTGVDSTTPIDLNSSTTGTGVNPATPSSFTSVTAGNALVAGWGDSTVS